MSDRAADYLDVIDRLTRERDEARATVEHLQASLANVPRCNAPTPKGYKCARRIGHTGAHNHPRDPVSS